jgi:hypothetical protein
MKVSRIFLSEKHRKMNFGAHKSPPFDKEREEKVGFYRLPPADIRLNQSHTREFDAFLIGETIVAMQSAVSHPDVGAVDVAIGDGRLADAALEAVNMVEQTEVFDDHRRARAQLVTAVAAELLAGDAEDVHGWKHWDRRWRHGVIHHRLLLGHHQEGCGRLRHRWHLAGVEDRVSDG